MKYYDISGRFSNQTALCVFPSDEEVKALRAKHEGYEFTPMSRQAFVERVRWCRNHRGDFFPLHLEDGNYERMW